MEGELVGELWWVWMRVWDVQWGVEMVDDFSEALVIDHGGFMQVVSSVSGYRRPKDRVYL